MSDPLSITASVIAVAGVAYSSVKLLHETISGIQDAPETIIHLKTEVGILYETIHSLKQRLAEEKEKDSVLSEAQRSNLREIEPSLDVCHNACDAFQTKMAHILRHSTEERISTRDKIKMHLREKEIVTFQVRLESYKSTFAISLEFLSLKTMSENLNTARNLETKIEDLGTRLTGQMQGLQIGLQAILDLYPHDKTHDDMNNRYLLASAQSSEALSAIEKQNISLLHCYKACMAALQETTKATGHIYKYIKASKDARLLMGDLGNVQGAALHQFSNIDIEGSWVVAGNMAGDAAKDFFK